MHYLALSLLLTLGAGALPQAPNPAILAPSLSLLLALGAGALPQAPSPAPSSPPFDKRADDPVIEFFDNLMCYENPDGPTIPMTTNCTNFQPYGTYQRFKVTWHHGPGKVEFFRNENCVRSDDFHGLLTRADEQDEFTCQNAWKWNGVAAMMVPP